MHSPVLFAAGPALIRICPACVTAALLAIPLFSAPLLAQTLREQREQAAQARAQLEDPSFRELIPLIPEARQPARTERQPIFYPPTPPPLDRPVAHLVVPPGRFPAPPELAAYANEIFYPALGSRLQTKTLYHDLRQRLEVYRTTKVVLQRELRDQVDKWRQHPPAERRKAMQDFSRLQTPKIAELEKTAEQLRRSLVTTNFSWSALREWHLVDKEKRGFSPLEIAMVTRGYAFYKRNLSAPQRRLLREITLELHNAVDDATKASQALPHLFFSPEPARVMFPDDMPPAVASKLATYQLKKAHLKKELYDLVTSYDGAVFGILRYSFSSLAERQQPVFEELEKLAEEIRVGLSEMPQPEVVEEVPPLPPLLAYRISNVLRDRALLEREATVKADAVIGRRYDTDVRVRGAYRFDEGGMKVAVVPVRAARYTPPKEEGEILAKVHAELVAIADDYGRRLAALLNEQENIRREAAELLRDDRRERVDAALFRTNRIAIMKENEDAYRDYRVAVFEPGLSPEQRRLLFDRAIERLELPLPRGEIQTQSRGKSW
jgi:hypothetical protein